MHRVLQNLPLPRERVYAQVYPEIKYIYKLL